MRSWTRCNAWLHGLNPPLGHPAVDVVLVEADVLADLVEGDAAFADQAADEALGRAEAFGELQDAANLSSGSRSEGGGLSAQRMLLDAAGLDEARPVLFRIASAWSEST